MEFEFRVRWYQRRFHRALVERTHDKLLAIWHRRAGKDEILMQGFREISRQRVGTYWHCLPEYEQARKALWDGINVHTGRKRVESVFPPEAGFKYDQTKMLITMPWGSTWQLIGSDRYDATVGSGPVGIGYSEWALSNPSAYAYHRPMLRESKGVAAFITTPRGNNHAKTMLDAAKSDPEWFWEVLSAVDTGALDAADLAAELRGYQALWGADIGRAYFEQEYLCSFSGALIGAFWGGEVADAERAGRLCAVPVNEQYPVHTAWDLGKAVNNPIWCFQVIAGKPYIVDFYRPESDDLEEWCAWLNERGYTGNDYVPHDAATADWGVKRTRRDTLKLLGRKPKMVPKVSVAEGINAGRETIKLARFHTSEDERGERMQLGVEGLRNYRREWDDELKTFRENPVKDWSEHIGSSFRYLGLAWRQEAEFKPKPVAPKELIYAAGADGSVTANMSVKQAVEAMVRRRRQR